MDKSTLPVAPLTVRKVGMGFEVPLSALDRWNPSIRAAAREDDEATISIYGTIGAGFFEDEGNTAKRISAALRAIGDRPVIVNINSPGGSYFEGLAIYNILREHTKAVTVKVVGVAASAASIIAMSGDTVLVPRAGFLMIHNTQAVCLGDRHEMNEMAVFLRPFDDAIASIFAARSGKDQAEIVKMMDRETWMGGADAVENGFADDFLPSDQMAEDQPDEEDQTAVAAHRLDAVLARAGMPRAERRRLIKNVRSTPSAAPAAGDTPSAVPNSTLTQVLADLRSISLTS